MGKAWEAMKSGRGEPVDVGQFSVGGAAMRWAQVGGGGIKSMGGEPVDVSAAKVRPGLAEDIYAGAFDAEVGVSDEYMTAERTPEGPVWHVGTMEQKVAYRSLARDEPTYITGKAGAREAATDLEVEQAYGTFLEEVQIGDRALLVRPSAVPASLYGLGEIKGEGEEEGEPAPSAVVGDERALGAFGDVGL